MRAEDFLAVEEAEERKEQKKKQASENGYQRYEVPKELPNYWYRSPGNVWFALDENREFRDYPTSHIRALLLESGVRGSTINGEPLSPVDQNLLAMRRRNVVSWAGELAGFGQGVHDICGQRILVTKGPKHIKAEKGSWETLRKFLTELLSDQILYFYGWIKSALRSMYSGHPFRPGQALALAGPAGCGKSLVQSLITIILGGRVARPYQFLMGDTGFNEDLLRCEHLVIEDEASSRDPRKRSYFGGQLKNLIANDVIRGHPKGSKAMYVYAFNRVTISLNDEPESLMVLPFIGDDMRDKITLLQAARASFPYGRDNLKARTAYYNKLVSELPAFLHFLSGWKIPPKMQDQRYGVAAFQNDELMGVLHQDQPEFNLMELIDRLGIWDVDKNPWIGTASQLKDDLREKDKHGRVAELLSWSTACGQYLAKLSKVLPRRVRKAKSRDGRVVWEVMP